ncbi:U3 snoRNP protein [Malassezia brasiliensis]|uniref:U3 snoRNP protein n=1 Tax=Malassezia brasiliensis TaxID=1821822 RepID=A0AAF0DV18_9BASI|nr:U3 snoRNP protein [Malassezia brasiliensis]
MSEAGRFKYVSFHERLRDVSIDLSRESESSWGASRLLVAGLDAPASAFAAATSAKNVAETTDPNSTAFGVALREWSELNLSLPFQNFYAEAFSKSQSLVLLLHHRDELADLLDRFLTLDDQNWLAWDAFLDLIPRLAFDLGPEFLPIYPRLLTALLRASSLMDKNVTKNDEATAARLVERAFHSAAWLFRAITTLMLRAADVTLLLESWAIIRRFLDPREGRTKAHTRRFATEAFAHLVRKVPMPKLKVLVARMLQDADCPALENGVAATLAYSCSSAAHALHSRTPQLLEAFLLHGTFPGRTQRIGCEAFTALVHHTKAPQMQKALEVLLGWTSARVDALDGEDETRDALQMTLIWLTYAVGTRKGTRVDNAIKAPLFALVRRLDERLVWTREAASLLETYCTLLALVLPLGRVQDSAGAGTDILRRFAHRLTTSFDVTFPAFQGVVLAETHWSGFRAFVLPAVLEATTASLAGSHAEQDAALLLLAKLDEQGHLAHLQTAPPTSTALRWTRQVRRVIDARLAKITDVDASLLAAVRLAPLFPTHAQAHVEALVHVIDERKHATDADEMAVLGALLAGVLRIAEAGDVRGALAPLFDGQPSAVVQLMEMEVRSVAEPLAALVAHGAAHGWALPRTTEALAVLRPRLLAADRILVLSALRILAEVHATAPFNVFSHLLATEELPLDVANVTTRNVKLRQTQREAFKALRGNDTQLQALVAYTVGTLKLNLKPIWKESRATLVALAARLPDVVWDMSFAELHATDAEIDAMYAARASAAEADADEVAETEANEDEDEGDEDEAGGADSVPPADAAEPLDAPLDPTLDDPQLRTRLATLRNALSLTRPTDTAKHAMEVLLRAPDVRFEARHYADQLLQVYEEHIVLVEKHATPFVEHVLAQWPRLVADAGYAPLKHRLARLERLLGVFGEVRTMPSLHASDTLWTHFVALCAHPELPIQRGALNCLLAWKHAWLEHHADRLRHLLDPVQFRETLAQLDLRAGAEMFASHRADLMPIVLRLLYGLMVSRRATRTSGAGQHARRTAILDALYECSADELGLLVDLMLQAFPDHGAVYDGTFCVGDAPHATPRQQLGVLTFLGDVLRRLGTPLEREMPRIVETIVTLAAHAAHDAEKSIYRLGLRRLADAVKYAQAPAWEPYAATILTRLVHPRLATLAQDSVQSPSALLDLVQTWAQRGDTMRLFFADASVLPQVYACLSSASIKPAVAHTVLDIAEHTLAESSLVRTSVASLLGHLSALVQRTIRSEFTYTLGGHARDELLRREMALLTSLGAYMEHGTDAAAVLALLVPLMRHSARTVPERTKLELLRTFETLLPLAPLDGAAFADLYTLFCRLGAELRSQNARAQYAAAFVQLVPANPSLARAAEWVRGLNAYTHRAIGEIDFDARLAAADAILAPDTQVSVDEWHALLYNALFFVTDTEELAMRTTGASILQRFVREAVPDGVPLVYKVLLPGLRRRLHARAEPVRKEVFGLLGEAVARLAPAVLPLQELQCLLVGGDEEASVFANLYHIQAHRRVRALHRLAEFAEAGTMRSKTLSELFVPLVWAFLQPNPSGGYDMNMVNEALGTIKRICAQLQWSHYYHWLTRFLREVKEHTKKEEASAAERLHVRGTVGVLEAFHFAMDAEAMDEEKVDDAPEEDDDAEDGEDEADDADDATDAAADLSATPAHMHRAASPAAIAQVVTERVLPQLHSALDTRDEERLPLRLPLLVGAARVAQHLPDERRRTELFKTFSGVAMALRSKLQSTRDTTRDIALQLVRAIGATYFAPLVRELRRTLTRGPQRAVCAYSVHSLLVALSTKTPTLPPLLTLIDDGVHDVVAAAVEDIFGETGEDREAIENKTKVREMRQSKSMDTLEQLARLAAPTRLNELLLPLRDVLSGTSAPKTLRTAEECLRRIASGVNANEHLDAGSLLVLCHTLIARGVSALGNAPRATKRRKDKHEVQSSRKEAEHVDHDHLAQNAHLFVDLGLDMLTTALRRSRFDVHDEATIAKLMPMLPAVGETLYARHAPVVERGLRAAAALSRVPLPNLTKALPVIQRQILAILRHTGGLHSAVAQAAVRALAVMLRDCKTVPPQEQQLTELLRLVAPDVDDPDVGAVVFALLRAVVSRAFVVPEIYDVMDRIAELLVTSHDAQVREVCRALYLQFLLDYPQGKGRLESQLQFLAKNLAYETESGRRSVLELLGAVLAKFSAEVVNAHADLFFVALVMQLCNDESVACKQQAAHVLGILLAVLDDRRWAQVMGMTQKWANAPYTSAQSMQLAAVALRVYDLALARPDGFRVAAEAVPAVAHAITEGARDADAPDIDEDAWRITYQALQTLQTLLNTDASRTLAMLPAATADEVLTLLTYPHAWVRIAASRVVGGLFAASLPMEHTMHVRAAKQLVAQLHGATLDDALTLQVVRNLVHLGRLFAARGDQVEAAAADAPAEHPAEADADSDTSEDAGTHDAQLAAVEAAIDAVGDRARGAEENPLAWLFTKLSHAARLSPQAGARELAPQRISAIFKWFAAIATQLEPARLETFLVHILSPIQRIVEDDTADAALRTLADEVQELVQGRVSAPAFTRAYAHVRQSIATKRRERRNARLLQGVTDPERAASRRHARNVHKHESRKRKNAAFREGRVRNVRKRT